VAISTWIGGSTARRSASLCRLDSRSISHFNMSTILEEETDAVSDGTAVDCKIYSVVTWRHPRRSPNRDPRTG
jgi:hypothetical protein